MVSGPCFSSNPCMNTRESHMFAVAKSCHKANQRMIHRLAAKAFRNILAKKQSKYRLVILWLDDAIRRTKSDKAKEMWKLNRIVKEGDAIFIDYKF